MPDFKNLLVWQKSHGLALRVHSAARRIQGSDYLSLRSQLIRAAMSIPANIVEGRSQQSEREFSRFLKIALNSASELEYHLIAAHDMGAMREGDFLSLSNQTIEVRKMLYGLLARIATGSRFDTPPSDRAT